MIITLTGVSGTRHLWYCGQGRALPERQRCAIYKLHMLVGRLSRHSKTTMKIGENVQILYRNSFRQINLGAFVKFRKATVSFVMCLSVRTSAWNNSAFTGRIFVKFGI